LEQKREGGSLFSLSPHPPSLSIQRYRLRGAWKISPQMVTTIDLLDTDDESSPARLPTSRPNPSHNNNNHQATRNTATGTNAVAGPSNTGVRQSGGTGRNSNSGFATSKGKQKEKEKVVTEITLSSDDDDGDDVDERNRTVRRPPTVSSPFLSTYSSFPFALY